MKLFGQRFIYHLVKSKLSIENKSCSSAANSRLRYLYSTPWAKAPQASSSTLCTSITYMPYQSTKIEKYEMILGQFTVRANFTNAFSHSLHHLRHVCDSKFPNTETPSLHHRIAQCAHTHSHQSLNLQRN